MEQTEQPGVLQWRDLEANDVYHIAHAENEMRDGVAALLSRIVFTDNPVLRRHIADQAESMLANQEARSASWLADRAALHGLIAAGHTSYSLFPKPEEGSLETPSHYADRWLDVQMTEFGMSSREVAQMVGTSHTTIADARGRRREISAPHIRKLATAFADKRGLAGPARDAFIADAFRQTGFAVYP
jgi:hypothetical protein